MLPSEAFFALTEHSYGVRNRAKAVAVGGADATNMAEATAAIADKLDTKRVIRIDDVGGVELSLHTDLVCSVGTFGWEQYAPICGGSCASSSSRIITDLSKEG